MTPEEELELLRYFFTWDVKNLLELKSHGQKFTNENSYIQERWMGDYLISTKIMGKGHVIDAQGNATCLHSWMPMGDDIATGKPVQKCNICGLAEFI